MISSYPKIFTVGQDYIRDLFNEEVEITEKLDGSQFVFGKIDGVLYMRSKGAQIFPEAPQKMFLTAIDYVMSLNLPDGIVFYCEYMSKPKHNVLKYERVPLNNLMLFGVADVTGHNFYKKYSDLTMFAEGINIEPAPILFQGKIIEAGDILDLMNTDSHFGGVKIEGIIVKNYHRPFLLGGQPIPLMAGKFVSEKYKEISGKYWSKEHTNKGKWETLKENYRTESRWLKSIQHLRDDNLLENSPKDIGFLIKAIQQDIIDEEKDNIKEFLWKEFGQELLRKSTSGFPEFYKKYLMEKQFE